MRSSLGWKSLSGMLALLATFVLALPGVKVVRAEEPRSPVASHDGPTCNDASPEATALRADQTVQQLQAQILARIAAEGGSPEGTPILLNGRGYNYGSGNDLERIAADAQRLQGAH
jgi:hypothetical protein